MNEYKISLKNFSEGLFVVAMLMLAACSTPSTIPLPSNDVLREHRIETSDISRLPPAVTRVLDGDALRILRDAQRSTQRDDAALFVVRSDGTLAYPNIGIVKARGRTPEEIGNEISQKLSHIYRYPTVTVNIATTSANRVFVGGAVRNPSSVELGAVASIEQAIIGAGGFLPVADSRHVGLLRMDSNGLYHVYFSDLSQLLTPTLERKAVILQRGDVVFVPKSSVGNAIEFVDVYVNQLLPFSKNIGIGLNYNLNPRTN